MPIIQDFSLVDLEPERDLMVSRVNTHDADKLIYIREIGLVPGAEITLISRAPFNGPLRLKIGRDEQVIGAELASVIRVCEHGKFIF